ncbi:MAG: peptidoglycan editing factor PgeF [Eubacteriales bacterium]
METKVFNIHTKGKLVYLTFPSLEKTGLVNHCFSTRLGGVSKSVYSTLNLGYNRGDSDVNVDNNYKIICDAIGVNHNNLVFSDQVHGDDIYIVTKEDIDIGRNNNSNIINKDALITNEKNIPLVTLYADCVPLFFLDPVKKVIGLAHAGWRGTVKKIGKKTVLKMAEVYGSNIKDIIAGIAPSIGGCCFEVGEEVVDMFRKFFLKEKSSSIIREKRGKKYMLDLWEANYYTLLEAGLLIENITLTDICTKCHSDIFFSHRDSGGERGSLAAIIALKG